jgi:3-dehydroquinate synthase
MSAFAVLTASQRYEAVVENGCLARLHEFIPARAGTVFVVTTEDVWKLHGHRLEAGLAGRPFQLLYFPGGEERKRMASVEQLAEQMVAAGGDRSSIVVAFGGGITTDLGGFLAAVFMRGIPVIQVPTTLLAQVDAAVGGKTGANLVSGKNLVGSFHQPLVVLTDPSVLSTLPEREYHAGLFEVIKCGVIRSEPLFRLMQVRSRDVLVRHHEALWELIAESVRIKCEVVSADEKESGLRRILNFGHTVGHAIEAETRYARFLHGEAVALGMKAAAELSVLAGKLSAQERNEIHATIDLYGPLPPYSDLDPVRLLSHLVKDKKTVRGAVHFVLATRIGETVVQSGIDNELVLQAIRSALR